MRLDGIRRSLLGHGLVDAPSGFPCDETLGAEVRFDKVFSLIVLLSAHTSLDPMSLGIAHVAISQITTGQLFHNF